MLDLDPRSPLPLWRQIEDGVRNLVAAGVLAPGVAVPSVRELARDLTVNPATIAKAYQRLGDAGVLEVRRGEGTFVAAGPPVLPVEERRRRLADAARGFAATARTLRLPVEVAVELVREAMGDGDVALDGRDGGRDETSDGDGSERRGAGGGNGHVG